MAGAASLAVVLTLSGCSSDDDGSPDGDGAPSATTDGSEGAADPGGCELPVTGGDEVLSISAEIAEQALEDAGIEATSVDVGLQQSGATCGVSWDDAAKGGLMSISAPEPGSSDPGSLPGSYEVGAWTCLTQQFDKRIAGGICATDTVDLAVVLEPGTEDETKAALEVLLPALEA